MNAVACHVRRRRMYLQPPWLLVRMCVRLPYVGFHQCLPSDSALHSTPQRRATRHCGRERHPSAGCGMDSKRLNAGVVDDAHSPVADSIRYRSPHWAMLAAQSQQGGHGTRSRCRRRPRACPRMLPFRRSTSRAAGADDTTRPSCHRAQGPRRRHPPNHTSGGHALPRYRSAWQTGQGQIRLSHAASLSCRASALTKGHNRASV